jgi:hypothetical protein
LGFSLISSLLAGFLATVMLSLALEVASFRGMTSMPSMPLILGTFVSGDHDLAVAIGSALHFAVIGPVVTGSLYGLLFSFIDATWWLAILVGLLHGTVIGVGMGHLSTVHPRIIDVSATVPDGGVAAADLRDGVVLKDPRVFGVGWGDLTPVVLVGSYACYGLVFALVYSQLA